MGIWPVDRVDLPAEVIAVVEGPVPGPGLETVAEEEGRIARLTKSRAASPLPTEPRYPVTIRRDAATSPRKMLLPAA